MIITELEAWAFHAPLDEPFHPSWVPGYTSMNNSAVIYRLKTDEGLEGIAGSVTFGDEAKGPVNLLRAYIGGLDPTDTEEVHARLQTANRTLGVRAWFLETAVWDLKGKAEGKSIAELLGAKRDKIKVYASTGEKRVAEEAAPHAAKTVAEGFPGIKIRPRHATLEEDIAMVKAVREAIGDDIALMADANQAWRVDVFEKGPFWDLERATKFAKACENFNLSWIEEPLDMYDFKGYAELRKNTSTPIAAGELHGDPGLVRLLMDADGVDIVQPDLVFTGGISGAFTLAKEADERRLKFAPHTWTNGLGLAANLQIAMAAPNCEWLEFPFDRPGWVPHKRDAMLADFFLPDPDGFLHLPKGPGLGVELNEDALTEFGTPL